MDEPQHDGQTEPQHDPLEDDALREEAEHPEADDGEGGADDDAAQGDDGEPSALGDDEARVRAIESEKELQRRDQRLDAENQRHAKRVSEIMEEAGNDLIPCPVCMDGIAGWVYSPEVQQLPEDSILRLRQLIGLSGLEGLREATFAERCPDCDGQGEVKTGSRVAGYETATCERCGKTGWIRVGTFNGNGAADAPPAAPVTGPTTIQAASEDPEIRNLRERGFTVIPPMAVPAG